MPGDVHRHLCREGRPVQVGQRDHARGCVADDDDVPDVRAADRLGGGVREGGDGHQDIRPRVGQLVMHLNATSAKVLR